MADSPRRQIIRGGRILSLPGHRGDFGDLLLEGDTIRAVGPRGLAAPPGAETIDARDRLLLPGLINAHTHAHGALGGRRRAALLEEPQVMVFDAARDAHEGRVGIARLHLEAEDVPVEANASFDVRDPEDQVL